jgi:hypothetical protein
MKRRWTQSIHMKTADPVSVEKCMTQAGRILHESSAAREEENAVAERQQFQANQHS